jgi:hypothetical protein
MLQKCFFAMMLFCVAYLSGCDMMVEAMVSSSAYFQSASDSKNIATASGWGGSDESGNCRCFGE